MSVEARSVVTVEKEARDKRAAWALRTERRAGVGGINSRGPLGKVSSLAGCLVAVATDPDPALSCFSAMLSASSSSFDMLRHELDKELRRAKSMQRRVWSSSSCTATPYKARSMFF